MVVNNENQVTMIVEWSHDPLKPNAKSKALIGFASVPAQELINALGPEFNASNIRSTSIKRSDEKDINNGIEHTLLHYPNEFAVCNDGVYVEVKGYEKFTTPEGSPAITLVSPSIMNGGKTREEVEKGIEIAPDAPVKLTILMGEFLESHRGYVAVSLNTHGRLSPANAVNAMNHMDGLKSKLSPNTAKIDWKNPKETNLLLKSLLYVTPGHTYQPHVVYNGNATTNRVAQQKAFKECDKYDAEDIRVMLGFIDSIFGALPEVRQIFDEIDGGQRDWKIFCKTMTLPWSGAKIQLPQAVYAIILSGLRELFDFNKDTVRITALIELGQICEFWKQYGGQLCAVIDDEYAKRECTFEALGKDAYVHELAQFKVKQFIREYKDSLRLKEKMRDMELELVAK